MQTEKEGQKIADRARATAVIVDFIQTVEEMRYHQRAFFNEKRDPGAKKKHLDNAKAAEKKVDGQLLKFNISSDGKVKYSEQKSMF